MQLLVFSLPTQYLMTLFDWLPQSGFSNLAVQKVHFEHFERHDFSAKL